MDDAAFFAAARSTLFGGSLSQRVVDRLNAIFDAFATYGDGDPNKLAYICATAHHESGRFVYDREIWGPTAAQTRYEGRADLGNTVAGDGKRFMGRGFVCMITGRHNYADWSERLGLDLIGNPELAADPTYAARIGVDGMMLGTFTGKSLSDYINERGCDYLNARRVVNVTDKAATIAGYAEAYADALERAGYGAQVTAPAPVIASASIEDRLAALEAWRRSLEAATA